MDKPKNSKEMLDVYDVLERIARLPDDIALTTDEAALYLRLSRTTLERMRVDGSGPVYIQGGGKSARGTNQKITYKLGELRAWRNSHAISSSMAAAVRRGMTFTTLKDAMRRIPFWHRGERILGRVLDDAPEEYLHNRECLKIVWMPSADAVFKPWVNPEKHYALAVAYKSVLAFESDRLQAVLK
jgi:hypothetical protein